MFGALLWLFSPARDAVELTERGLHLSFVVIHRGFPLECIMI